MIFHLKHKTDSKAKYLSVNIKGNFESGGLMAFILT